VRPSEAAVLAALQPVTDPELDQSVVELGFVHDITVDGDGTVTVGFRLPTFWCSANFAFIMAEDMRRALRALPGVERVRIRLVDHFAAGKINAGIEQDLAFREVFGAEAADDLEAVRNTFREKAFLGRQAALIHELRQSGWSDERIVALDLVGLECLPPSAARDRYRAALPADHAAASPVVTDLEGRPIAAAALTGHLREARRVRMSAEANGEMCRILLKARYAPATRMPEPAQ
jgi:metal-sulfur cluster biosynthetic enzyme